jgi:hypothetical protein
LEDLVELSASKASDLMGCGEFLQCLIMLIGGLKLWIVVVGLLAGTIADSQ